MSTRRRRTTRRAPMKRRFGIPRSVVRYNKVPSFVETFKLENDLQTQTGGRLGITFSQIPQYLQYGALYNQYRVNWIKYTLVPQWTSFDPNGSVASAPRIAYAIQNTPNEAAPLSEAQVLTDNGVRIRMLNKPVSFSHRPVPDIGTSVATGGFTPYVARPGQQWMSLQDGSVVPHGYINYWISGPTATPLLFKTYVKVSFSLKDAK